MPEKLAKGPRIGHDLSKVSAGLSRGPNTQRKLTAAPWSGTWPAPGSTLDLDFANNRGWVRGVGQGGVMDALTFTRGSTGRYIDSAGLLQAATNHVPRFDWASMARTGSGTLASPYVTPLAANPTCNGILIEESRANRLLWCRDATQSGSWTCTNVTPLLNQTGIDGVANAASSLTASADGGTCIQTITLASGSRTGSVYLKRLTGTGDVQISLDGSTWSTVDLSSTEWRRIVLSGTVTNPVVAIKLATNGDAVAMDFAQVEDNLANLGVATSPILTTNASAARSADTLSISKNNLTGFNSQQGTAMARLAPPSSTGTSQRIILRTDSARYILNYHSSGGSAIYDGASALALTTNRPVDNEQNNFISAWSPNGVSACLNGGPVATGPTYNGTFNLAYNVGLSICPAITCRLARLIITPKALARDGLMVFSRMAR